MDRYTDEQKAEAVELAQQVGLNEAARRLSISKASITRWTQQAGLTTDRASRTRGATQQRTVDLELRKVELAHGLMDDVFRLRGQLFAPCVDKVVKTVGVGDGCSNAEVITVDHTQPPFGDKQRLMVSIGIAVDKIQLLSGAATERHEHLGVFGEEQAVGLRDELAARRQRTA